jgi:protein phosphatase
MNLESIYYLFEAGTKAKQEDYIWPPAGKATMKDKVFIVCDGSGSFYGGEVASELICRFMAAKVLRLGEQRMSKELISQLLDESRDRLITYARDHRLDTEMATTFSMLILYDQKALISWCGDGRIYHLRGGEILFSTNDSPHDGESTQYTNFTGGIKADSSPINAETKWITDLHDGDYFLLCSKGIVENITDDDIKLLVRRNDKAQIDLTESFKQLVIDKAPDNYSMYLIKLNTGTQKRSINNGIVGFRRPPNRMVTPMSILVITFILFLIMVYYFRKGRTSNPAPKYTTTQTTRPADVPVEDTVPSAIVMSAPRKPVSKVADTVKSSNQIPEEVPPEDSSETVEPEIKPEQTKKISIPRKESSAIVQPDVKPEQTKKISIPRKESSAIVQPDVKPEQTTNAPSGQKRQTAQLMLKLTTDESCKLEIRNIDLDQVIPWDLSPDDNGTIYLKPGKYSIVATSVNSSSKSKTYNFEVKSGSAQTTQNIHIKF